MNILSSMLNFLLNRIDTVEQKVYDELSIEKLEKEFKQWNLNINHPVGSYFITDNAEHNPETMFGGTWSKVQGRFLVGAGDNGLANNEALNLELGAVGGESVHRLTSAESGMPTHNHTFPNGYWALTSPASSLGANAGDNISGSKYKFPWVVSSSGWYRQFNTADRGGVDASVTHNNLPPYKAVNIWVRTA